MAVVFHSAAQSIPNNTETTAAFNSERYDKAGGAASTMHNTVTNKPRLKISREIVGTRP